MMQLKKRIPALMLALTLVLSVFACLPAFAAESEQRFIFDALRTESQLYTADNEALAISVNGGEAFVAEGLDLLTGDTNAFYVSLVNRSNATKIRVTYTYELYAVTKSDSTEHELIPSSESEQAFVLEAPYVRYPVKSVEILFLSDKALEGTLILNSFFNFSTYVNDTEYEAAFSRCHYNAETGNVEIEGSLSYAATVRYEGETLALFALSDGEDMHLISKTPLARTDISFHFAFTIKADHADDLFSRYVVAAVTSSGERVPLCTPTYPSFTVADSTAAHGFKGFHAGEELKTVLDVNPDVAIFDIYLNRLFATRGEGILYAGQYEYYYFSQEYMAQIDRFVENMAGIGSHVYFRLLVDAESKGLSFVDDAPGGVKYRMPVLRNETAHRDVYAVIDFLTSRYQGEQIGGLILGRAADLTQVYNYSAAANLSEYSQLYASLLNLVAGVARTHIPQLRILVPISDLAWSQRAGAMQAGDIYYGEVLLPSLLAALEGQILDPQDFGILLESAVLSDRMGGTDKTHFGIDRINTLLSDIASAAQDSPYLDTDVVFSWLPNENAAADVLRADYLLKYAALYQNALVSAFVVDFADVPAHKKDACVAALSYMATYIDTDRNEEVTAAPLITLGAQSITELYPALVPERFRTRRIYRTDLVKGGYPGGILPKGSYTLWSFDSATDTQGWYRGKGDVVLSVLPRENEGNALTAAIRPGSGNADIAYRFDGPVDLSFAPLLSVDLGIYGVDKAGYEVQIRLIGDAATLYASAVLAPGENTTLYLNLTSATLPLSSLRCVRVMVRPLNGGDTAYDLRISRIRIESAVLDHNELSARVSAIRENTATGQDEVQGRDYTAPILITATIVLVSAGVTTVVILASKARRNRKKSNKIDSP